MQFWYYINGPDGTNGKLSLAQQNNGAPSETTVWSNDFYENGTWRYGQVGISGGVNPFVLLFEATKSSSDVVIGIDDAVLTLGYCPPPVDCTFESTTLCSWTQLKDDDFDWLLQSGETISFGTGPTVGKKTCVF